MTAKMDFYCGYELSEDQIEFMTQYNNFTETGDASYIRILLLQDPRKYIELVGFIYRYGKCVGYSVISFFHKEARCDTYILPKYRRHGYASKLLIETIKTLFKNKSISKVSLLHNQVSHRYSFFMSLIPDKIPARWKTVIGANNIEIYRKY